MGRVSSLILSLKAVSGTFDCSVFCKSTAGILIVGSSSAPSIINGGVTGNTFSGIGLSRLTLAGGVALTAASQVTLSDDTISDVALAGGSSVRIVHDLVGGISIDGVGGIAIQNNSIGGGIG